MNIIIFLNIFVSLVNAHRYGYRYPNRPRYAVSPATLYLASANNVIVDSRRNLNQIISANQVKFIIHGYSQSSDDAIYVNMAKAYVDRGGSNVIKVDYTDIAVMDVTNANWEIGNIATYVSKFIIELNRNRGIPFNKMHLIGHSLGAQVASFVGKNIIAETGRKIGRITALDAARPGFESIFIRNKLNKTDATIVDVLHTDAGRSGYLSSAGTVDFFPNGGAAVQPGCTAGTAINVLEIPDSDGWKSVLISDNSCSAARSNLLFTESISSKNFVATKCDSWASFQQGTCANNQKIVFGEDLPTGVTGNFYFATGAQSPFSTI